MKLFLPLLAALAATASFAEVRTQQFLPESGFYWNPDQPGRGYAIEIQDRSVFITAYVYTDQSAVRQREPLWFSSGGTLVSQGSGSITYRFNNELFYSEDGQCLGCSFVEPVTTATGRPISITFASPVSATLNIDGERIPIVRFWYSDSISNPISALMGQWTVVTDFTDSDSGVLPFDGDLLEIGIANTFDGQPVAEGFRGGTALAVTGAYDAANDFFVIVVAERSNEFLAYYFDGVDFGTDRFNALAERFTPGADLTGRGFPAYGYRISDRTFTENALGSKRNAKALPDIKRPQHREDDGKAPGFDAIALNSMVRSLEQRLMVALDR